MINRRWIAAAALLAACGGGTGGGAGNVHPANTATAAVESFMRAVADSNLNAMATLWGTAAGPAATTKQPPDYERRVAVMRSYLANEDWRVLSDAPDGTTRSARGPGADPPVRLPLYRAVRCDPAQQRHLARQPARSDRGRQPCEAVQSVGAAATAGAAAPDTAPPAK